MRNKGVQMTDVEARIPQSRTGPGIDQLAPDFEARTTRGMVRLSDYRGKWLIFFSHPADFTPVCTTEFMSFERHSNAFDKLNCALLGLSVDSVFSHIAWVKDIEANFGVKITFPIIEDISMEISRAYGMVHERSSTTAAVRSVYFIDPDGYVRSMIHYPANVGRSVPEILRVLAALQLSDAQNVATPENWSPGDKAVRLPPLDQSEADARSEEKDSVWYVTEIEGGKNG
tara:strand:- start:7328 stop:8014 length:687 start_codon:yes stop_codon:yes gene_type:complete